MGLRLTSVLIVPIELNIALKNMNIKLNGVIIVAPFNSII